ncbi:MAG: aspartate dehydrogenase, partial [Alphaproteobacteria bacterium]
MAATGERLRVAVAGLGAIGGAVAARLDAGLPGLELAAVAARDAAKARRRMAGFGEPAPLVPL